MVTGCQMTDLGGRKLPKSGRELNKTLMNSEGLDALKNGLYCLHFEYKDVIDNLDAFKKLMASDNWNAQLTLDDDELTIGKRMIKLVQSTEFKDKTGQAFDKASSSLRVLNIK